MRQKPKFSGISIQIHFWGAQWTINTLLALDYPEGSRRKFVIPCSSTIKDGGLIQEVLGRGITRMWWTGASEYPLIVKAYQKGNRGFDVAMASKAFWKNHALEELWKRQVTSIVLALGGGFVLLLEKWLMYLGRFPEGKFRLSSRWPKAWPWNMPIRIWTLAQFCKSTWRDYYSDWSWTVSTNYATPLSKESGAGCDRKMWTGNGRCPFQIHYEYICRHSTRGKWKVRETCFDHMIWDGLATFNGWKRKTIICDECLIEGIQKN